MTDAPGLAGISRRWGADSVAVVLAEESPLVRRQLLLVLEADPRIEVVAETADAAALVEAVVVTGTRVVVVGSRLPPEGGGQALGACRRAQPLLGAVVVDGSHSSGGLPVPNVVTVALDDIVGRLAAAVLSVA